VFTRPAAGLAAALILSASAALAAPALAAPAAPVAGAACQPGQGVTLAVDFSPVRDQVDIRCAPDAAGTVRDAFAAAGFDFGESGTFITEIDGVDAAALGEQGWWGLFASTADGLPGGPAGDQWQMAMVGADSGPVQTDEAYFFRLFESWSATGDPRLSLAEVVGHAGTDSTPPPARVDPAPANAAQAAGWIGRELAASDGVATLNGAADWGLTIDALFALAAAGVGGDQAAATAAKLQASGEAYAGAAAELDAKWPAVAKLALALQVAGLEPAVVQADGSNRDLIADLRAALGPDGSFGTGDNSFSHPLALIALARTDGGAPPAAVAWLTAQQCADADDPAHGSFGWTAGCGSPDPDATAMAIQGLLAGGLEPTSGPVAGAAAWLAAAQAASGGFPSSWGAANANTTGLAGLALALAGGHDQATAAAAGYVGALQLTCAALAIADTPLTEDSIGAIAFDQAGFDAAVADGIDDLNADQFRRATSQAVFALDAPGLVALTLEGAAAALPSASCAAASSPPPSASSTGAASPSGAATGPTPTASQPAALPPTGPGVGAGLPLAAIAALATGAALVARRRRVLGQLPQPGR
jgi:hypothetical protein